MNWKDLFQKIHNTTVLDKNKKQTKTDKEKT